MSMCFFKCVALCTTVFLLLKGKKKVFREISETLPFVFPPAVRWPFFNVSNMCMYLFSVCLLKCCVSDFFQSLEFVGVKPLLGGLSGIQLMGCLPQSVYFIWTCFVLCLGKCRHFIGAILLRYHCSPLPTGQNMLYVHTVYL